MNASRGALCLLLGALALFAALSYHWIPTGITGAIVAAAAAGVMLLGFFLSGQDLPRST
jgi:hypothetical protein